MGPWWALVGPWWALVGPWWASCGVCQFNAALVYTYTYIYIYIERERGRERERFIIGKGQLGSALMGSLRLFVFFDGLLGYQSVEICQICKLCIPFSPICQKSFLLQRPQSVLTPFARKPKVLSEADAVNWDPTPTKPAASAAKTGATAQGLPCFGGPGGR